MECVQDSGMIDTGVRARYMGIEEGTKHKLEVAEMRMLRCMCGVSKLDKITIERIRGTSKVGESAKLFQERR